jgi:tetratricopeptide (TPR) repeat protein
LKSSAKKIIFGTFFALILLFIAKQAFAAEFVSTDDAINKIERILSNPKGSIILDRKSTVNIDKTKKEKKIVDESQDKPKIVIEVIEKRDSKANRLKEKLAYNATLSGQYEASLEFYKQILASEPNNDYAKFGLATSYHKLKQYKQAKQAYYELLSTEIENKDEVIGNFLEILVEESPSNAKYVLARLSAQSPNADYILARSALAYDKINKQDESILLLKRAISLNPKNNQYHLNLAIILDKNNESQEALKYYRKVVNNYVRFGSDTQQIDLTAIRQRINFIEGEG